MTEKELEAYVASVAPALGVTLTPDVQERVTATFARNAQIAGLVTAFELPDDVESPAVFVP